MDDQSMQALKLLTLRQKLEQLRQRYSDYHAKQAKRLSEFWYFGPEQQAEFLAFWWASYSRLLERGVLIESAYCRAIQNARRSVLRGSKFLQSDYCGNVSDRCRSARRPKVKSCACGASQDVHRHCRHCGQRARGSLQNPAASYVDCLDPLPLRQLADRAHGGPSPALWVDRGRCADGGLLDGFAD